MLSGLSASPSKPEFLAEPIFPSHFNPGPGFPSARVGLGSPNIEAWLGRRSRRGSGGSESQSEKRRSLVDTSSGTESDRRKSLVSTVSGLPSPPGTNSDIALPNIGEPSLMMESPPIDLSSPNPPIRFPRPLSQPVSNLALSTSATSSRDNDLSASSRTLRPPDGALARSASSSSSISHRSPPRHSPHDMLSERRRTPLENRRASLEPRKSPIDDQSRSTPPLRSSLNGRRSSIESSGSPSRHRHSPSAPLPRSPNKSRLSLDHSLTASPIDEEEAETLRHARRQSTGVDLDAKIREAEEKIRQSARRPRTSPGLKETPTHQTLRRHDSYPRASSSPIPRNAAETLRKSATAGGTIKRSPRGLDPDEINSLSEKDRSGGSSGSAKRKPLPASFRNSNGGMFTPSPSVKSHDHPTPPPQDEISPANSSRSPLTHNRFSTTSRLAPSPRDSDRFRSPQMETRPWPDSITRGHSLRESPGSVFERRSRTDSLRAQMSRLALSPSDSVSAIGARSDYNSPSKDPLEVLRRIEAQRHQHNQSWDLERSASVLGNRPTSGPSESPRHARPTTSMTSLRSPRAVTRRLDDSPIALRSSTRMSHFDAEPRTKRSSVSLGARSNTSLDIHTASTDHGRLLFEACRALDLKISSEGHPALVELLRTFTTASKSAERINTAVRAAVDLGDRALIGDDVEHLDDLMALLREAGRASDQNIRDLTRIMLDLPRILREPRPLGESRAYAESVSTPRQSTDYDSPRRYRPRPASPVRRSEEKPRASTSASFYSPSSRRPRESLPPSFVASPVANRGVSALVSKVRANLGSPRRLDHGAIEASPPLPANAAKVATPLSPARRNSLRKRSSVTSNHTVRASGTFLPSEGRGKATTAVSAITAGNQSPPLSRFTKTSMDWDRDEERRGRSMDLPRASTSPMSRLSSYYTADQGEGQGSVGSYDADAVSLLEHRLADAQKAREEQGGADLERRATIGAGGERRKESVSERFRATLRRNRDER